MASYSSTTRNGYTLILDVNVTSQNVSANTSVVSWILKIRNTSTYYNARHTGKVVLGGVTVWTVSGTTFNSGPSGATKTIASGSRTYSHASDGTLSLGVVAELRTNTQGTSWAVPQLSINSSYSLPTIPRTPGKPAIPSMFLNHDTRQATITSAVAPSGAAIQGYEFEIRWHRNGVWGAWTKYTANSNRQITVSPGMAPVVIEARSRARTSVGWGPMSDVYRRGIEWRPAVLGLPTVTENTITREITVTAPVGDAYGSVITSYQIAIRDNYTKSGWSYYTANSARQFKFTPAKPLTTYDFKARAYSKGGWSLFGDPFRTIVSMGSGPKILHSGVWRNTNAFVKHNGVWKEVLCWINHNGTWRPSRR